MAGEVEKTPSSIAPPLLVAALVCDVAVADPSTGKKTLIGIFDRIVVKQFPTSRQMAVYLKVTDAIGTYNLSIKYVRTETDEVLGEVKGQLGASDPRRSQDLSVQLPPVPIPAAGRYEFRVFADSVYIGAAFVDAVERAAVEKPKVKGDA